MSDKAKRDVTIVNELGMHARAAAVFVNLAGRYQADLVVTKDDVEVNGKSIMGVLMLAASKGSRITLSASGSDAGDMVEALCELVSRGFDEPGAAT